MFEVNYTSCSAETQKEIRALIELWNEQSAHYTTKTSGSTGTPKSITLTRAQLEASARRTNSFFGLDVNSKVLMSLSPNTIGGKMMLIRALTGDYSIEVTEPGANPISDLSNKSHYSFISLVPYQVKRILEETPEKLDLFDYILLGGMGLSIELEKILSSVNPQVYIGFGMTETVSHIALRKMGNPVYEALEGVELEISDDCLVITDSKLGIERLLTNDIVRLHDSSHFEWLGRADFVINSGGIKIHPENIEQAIDPFIDIPFIIGGLPHEMLGEACVLILEKALPEEKFKQIQVVIREKFGKYAAPKQQLVSPVLKTENGKIRRKETLNSIL
ncbi:MAG: O-succinylbenzoate--CoA ligase [Fluviicola sp.]|jgi:O-succinylbenzoic acid--CoA ligase|uniref:AMP-binding protein n=1 Tax=Fluviicola sp. TaxID=1917219 RepID=UPI0026019C0D|nr:AMP-binding protein [Fluviicola sp.]MDF3026418.1 O-succinylbenzoate--CoA ligase [Fluviicola sp.]